ncbi:MAG: glutamate racemase [Eubacteriales bacterium]|nr:glutamate racemase [Eubacteriales bacterium]
MTDREKPIGVFDSGVGGLTVAREIMRNIPKERIVYFGDTARVPYGGKSKETILRYSRQIVRFLRSQEVKAIVIACNTASAFALEELSAENDIPVIGVVKSGAKVACATTKNNRVGVIGTRGTISSGLYTELIQEINPQIEVIGKACPLFCPLVEENWRNDDPITKEVTERYLGELREKDIDTLILGCTHYPLIRSIIGQVMGEQVTLVNPAYETACQLRALLQDLHLSNNQPLQKDEQPHRFYVSDAAESFSEFANSILPFEIRDAKKIPIEEY